MPQGARGAAGASAAPRVTIDLDIGGTFTDGFFTLGERSLGVKVDTTPHDLTVCFWACLEAGAARLGYPDVARLLGATDVIRFATTVGTNAILQRAGPKIGLIVSPGQEERIYAPAGPSPLLDRFLGAERVVALAADSGAAGEGPAAPDGQVDEAAVREAVKLLLDRGARHVVVSLEGAGDDAGRERRLKDLVRHSFPKHYLGSVPLLLSSELRPRLDDFTRTNVAVVNAYLHRDLSSALYRAEDRLRSAGYTRPLLVTHASGGAARVAKTRAVDTYTSGPVAGLFGCAQLAARRGLDEVATVDVGGTSTDIGVLRGGTPCYELRSAIAGVPVDLPFFRLESIAAGGGSIARVGPDGRLTVGPDSVGALPGPAAYGLGGAEAAVADAWLTLGYLDPDDFLGGRRRLDRGLAERAVAERVAAPLGLSPQAAALAVVAAFERLVVDGVRGVFGGRGPAGAVFAFGGGGGLAAAGLARAFGVEVYLFRQGAVLNAFGSSQMDVVHLYERSLRPAPHQDLPALLAPLLRELEQQALRDMRGEGMGGSDICFRLELELARGPATDVVEDAVETSWERTVARLLERVAAEDVVTAVRLRAIAPIPHAPLAAAGGGQAAAGAALRGERAVVLAPGPLEQPRGPLEQPPGAVVLPVYDQLRLEAGSSLQGPALVEGPDTTILVPPGLVFQVDELLGGVLRTAPGGTT